MCIVYAKESKEALKSFCGQGDAYVDKQLAQVGAQLHWPTSSSKKLTNERIYVLLGDIRIHAAYARAGYFGE